MIRFALVALLAATPALAQGQQPKHKITCMYDDNGNFTKAETGTPYAHPLLAVYTGRGGDEAWAYTIEAADGSACPAHLPNKR